jgi:arylsulfatase A-like enzyme
VFFYSDNGGPTAQMTSRNDPLRGFKGQMFEGGIRVPFLVQWKGKLPAGKVYREMVMGFDVHATALAAAGIAPTSEDLLDGVNLLPHLLGLEESPPHEALFWRSGSRHAARVGEWKLVRDPRGGGGDMLFNLAEDVGESNDLATAQSEKLQELQEAYAAWDRQMVPAKWVRQDSRNAELGGQLKSDDARRGSGGARMRALFDRLDRDKDGFLSPEEYNANAAISARRPFAAIDNNKDGKLTYAEVVTAFAGRRRGRSGA